MGILTDTEAAYAGLLADILEHPEDDNPRLVLADWFTENGQAERALAIREMCREPEFTVRVLAGKIVYCNLSNPMATFQLDCPIGAESVEWRRGFIESIFLTLAGFMGGPCERCGGRTQFSDAACGMCGAVPQHGYINHNPGCTATNPPQKGNKCPGCHGSDRTSGAVGVFAREPVTKVVLTDREPAPATHSDRPVLYAWANYDPPTMPHHLPGELHRLLPKKKGDLDWIRYYPTRDAALSALSRAATNYGRTVAGLSPLPPTPGVAA